MTFVLDTGAPKVYTSEPAKSILIEHGILVVDDELGYDYIRLMGHRYLTEMTPDGHSPANIIGLKPLCRWGLVLADEPNFNFNFNYVYHYRYYYSYSYTTQIYTNAIYTISTRSSSTIRENHFFSSECSAGVHSRCRQSYSTH